MNPQDPFAPQPQQAPAPTPVAQFGTGSLPPVGGTASPAVSSVPVAAEASAAPTPQLSADYLDQIAPKQAAPNHKFAVFGLIAAVLFAAVAVIIMVNSSGPNLSGKATQLRQRIETLQAVSDTEQKYLKENTISEANTTLSSALTSMSTDLASIVKSKGIGAAQGMSDGSYKSALLSKFDKAYQLGTLDRTYTAQMIYELQLLRSMLTTFKTAAGGSSVTTFCDTSIKNVDIIVKSMKSFAATK